VLRQPPGALPFVLCSVGLRFRFPIGKLASMNEITRLLEEAHCGNQKAASQLLPLVYDELRKLAAARMVAEPIGHTLQPTALVHEAYLRLVGPGNPDQWENRGHFFAAAAEAMRRILVDAARRKQAARHGGKFSRVPLPAEVADQWDGTEDVIAVSEALELLSSADAQAAELVKLHYFAGLTIEQTAKVLGVSPRKAYSVWAYARAWLYRSLGGESPS
jgi:RNA polymerase sigma factor (TIGR02999 family)